MQSTIEGEKCSHIRKDKIYHFMLRFTQRGIYRMIDENMLFNLISKEWVEGNVQEDRRGYEGPRYRLKITMDKTEIIVVVEKTSSCLLPITVWSKHAF